MERSQIVNEVVERLFACPGDYRITLEKIGDRIEIYAGGSREWMKLKEVADKFGVSTETIRNRYIRTKMLRRYPNGYRRTDVQRLLNQSH